RCRPSPARPDPGCAPPSRPTVPRSPPTPPGSRPATPQETRERATAWRRERVARATEPTGAATSLAAFAELVHELLEYLAEAVEATRHVQRLQQFLAEIRVGHHRRGDPVGDHPGELARRQGRVQQIGRTIQGAQQAAARVP